MNTTATHDTKRGEDVRARINVLSEFPRAWEERLRRWSRWNERNRSRVAGRPVPDPNEEVLLYQTLLGAWPSRRREIPAFRRRLKEYLRKAAREAKTYTSWLDPDPDHERALFRFVDGILKPLPQNRFLRDLLRWQRTLARIGALNGLSQVVVKVAAPGVADFYQGSALWDLNLVDPDNRRPVDFQLRSRMLQRLLARDARGPRTLARDLLARWEDGRVKLYLTFKALRFRRERPELFLTGGYLPLHATGRRRKNILAFARRKGATWAIAAVPRLVAKLFPTEGFPLGKDAWPTGSLTLPARAPSAWINRVTGEWLECGHRGGKKALPLHALFETLPVALLEGVPTGRTGRGAARPQPGSSGRYVLDEAGRSRRDEPSAARGSLRAG